MFCESFGSRAKCQCIKGYELQRPAVVGTDLGECVCVDDWCQEEVTTTAETKPTDITKPTMPTVAPVEECDRSILGDAVKSYCSPIKGDPFGASHECAAKCLDSRLIAYYNDQILEQMICIDGYSHS